MQMTINKLIRNTKIKIRSQQQMAPKSAFYMQHISGPKRGHIPKILYEISLDDTNRQITVRLFNVNLCINQIHNIYIKFPGRVAFDCLNITLFYISAPGTFQITFCAY